MWILSTCRYILSINVPFKRPKYMVSFPYTSYGIVTLQRYHDHLKGLLYGFVSVYKLWDSHVTEVSWQILCLKSDFLAWLNDGIVADVTFPLRDSALHILCSEETGRPSREHGPLKEGFISLREPRHAWQGNSDWFGFARLSYLWRGTGQNIQNYNRGVKSFYVINYF